MNVPADLCRAAAAPYRAGGRYALHFARGKLGGDPAFAALLRLGLIPDDARVLDIGCGQALLASWLHTAAARHTAGDWPSGWPPPPRPGTYHGIERMARDVARAEAALAGLGPRVRIECADMRTAAFPACDVVVILDVLHYVDFEAQAAVLDRVRTALAPHGTLLLRVGDAGAGLPFRLSLWVDHVVTRLHGHRLGRLYCRPLADWQALLAAHGFAVRAVPMSSGTPFANVLLIADRTGD